MPYRFNPFTNNLDYYQAGSSSTTDSFSIIQPDSGTSPTATSPNDTLTLTSSDNSIGIDGDSATDTIDFTVGNLNADYIATDGTSNPSADISLNSHKLTNLADPTTGTDAVTQQYLPARATYSYRKWVALFDNSLTTLPSSTPTIQGRTVQTGDDVLFGNLSDATKNNRVWTATVSGSSVTWALRKDGQQFNGDPTWGDKTRVRYGNADYKTAYLEYFGAWAGYQYFNDNFYVNWGSNQYNINVDNGNILRLNCATSQIQVFTLGFNFVDTATNISAAFQTKQLNNGITTTNNTPTTMSSAVDLNGGTAPYILEWYIFAWRTDVVGDNASWNIRAAFYNNSKLGTDILNEGRGSNSGSPPSGLAVSVEGDGDVVCTGITGQTWRWKMTVSSRGRAASS